MVRAFKDYQIQRYRVVTLAILFLLIQALFLEIPFYLYSILEDFYINLSFVVNLLNV